MEHLKCKNCGISYTGNYCPNCGQSAHQKRIDAHWLLHDVPHSIFHIDRGFFYTLKELFTAPGNMVKNYLEGKRVNYFSPFAYVVLMTTICSLIVKGLQSLTQQVYQKKFPGHAIEHSNSFFAHYFGLLIFIMVPVASFITWITFIRRKYNYWEHFVINTYLAAQLNLLLVIINFVNLIMAFFVDTPNLINFSLIIALFFTGFLWMYGYTYGSLFNNKKHVFLLSLKITVMNFFLSALYYAGLQFAGLIH